MKRRVYLISLFMSCFFLSSICANPQSLSFQTKTYAGNIQKIAYLTFDDGPSKVTPKILDMLDRYNVKATFFVIGDSSDFGKKMYRSIVERGHAIGNHTYSHDYKKIYRSVVAFKKDFNKLQDLLEDAIGHRPKIFRFPGGSDNTVSWRVGGRHVMHEISNQMLREGYMYFDWNADSEDASNITVPKSVIVRAAIEKSVGKQEVIVLLHDYNTRDSTVEALPGIIEGLQRQGYIFRTLSPDSFTVHLLK